MVPGMEHWEQVVDGGAQYCRLVELEVDEELAQNFDAPVASWLLSRAAAAHMDDRGRERATRVRTFEPISGTSVKY